MEGRSSAAFGHRCLQEGRQGAYPGSGSGSTRHVDDGEHVGVDHRRDPALREHLIAEQVSCVVIESTSHYCKVLLPARRRARRDAGQRQGGANVPGRRTDVSDAAWLADLGAHGLLRASFVPPEPIRCCAI